MAERPKTSFFLPQDSFRRRRLADAARVLPVLGGILMMIPMLWGSNDTGDVEAAKTSNAAIYVFVLWAIVIVAAAILAPFLAQIEDED